MISTALHVLGVYTRGAVLAELAEAAFVAALKVDVFEVEGVDVAGEVAGGEKVGVRDWARGEGREDVRDDERGGLWVGRERGSGTRERGAGRARENERSAGKGGLLGGKGGLKIKMGA